MRITKSRDEYDIMVVEYSAMCADKAYCLGYIPTYEEYLKEQQQHT